MSDAIHTRMRTAAPLIRRRSRMMMSRSRSYRRGLGARVRRQRRSGSLLVLDDLFPSLRTGFRVAEYSAYLDRWADSQVLTDTGSGVWHTWTENGDFQEELDSYASLNPAHEPRVDEFQRWEPLEFELGYCVFANLALSFLPLFERYRIPFAFTLYPGGGFVLDDSRSDAGLREIFGSPMFRRVIATQPATTQYLRTRGLVDEDQVTYVFGGPLQIDVSDLTQMRALERTATFDVCFVANKYSPSGRDKGYDLFIAAAGQLADIDGIRFHVVGSFSQEDLDVSGLGNRIHFYGARPNSFFPKFYRRMDAIVSPNRASVLARGAFDGFPTGACAEAGACGVIVIATDPLRQNAHLSDEEIIVVGESSDEIAAWLRELHADPAAVEARSQRTADAFRRLYGGAAQLEPRFELLDSLMRSE